MGLQRLGHRPIPLHLRQVHAALQPPPRLGRSADLLRGELTAPGIHIYGATQVGLPVLRFAFNDYIGYTHTVNTINPKTLYRIKVVRPTVTYSTAKFCPSKNPPPSSKSASPTAPSNPNPRDPRDHPGPIIKEEDGDPIALRVAGLDKPFMLEQYWKMSNAHNFAEFETQLKRLQPPCTTLSTPTATATSSTSTAATSHATPTPRRPRRKSLAFWAGLVAGDTSATLWHDYLTYEEFPQGIDPPNGYVQNTNEPPWDAAWPNNLDPAKYPPYTAPISASFRTERSLHMVAKRAPRSLSSAVEPVDHSKAESVAEFSPPTLIFTPGPQTCRRGKTGQRHSGVVLVNLQHRRKRQPHPCASNSQH